MLLDKPRYRLLRMKTMSYVRRGTRWNDSSSYRLVWVLGVKVGHKTSTIQWR
jgi:hypothetical protein